MRLGAGSLVEVRLHYQSWGREEGMRKVQETLKRLSGQASELEVVSEGAFQDKVQSCGMGLRTIQPHLKWVQEEEQVRGRS